MNAQAIVSELSEMHIRNPRLLAGLIAAKSISVDDGASLIETMIRDAARKYEQQTLSITLGDDWIGNAGFVLGRDRVYIAMSTLPALNRAVEFIHDLLIDQHADDLEPVPTLDQVKAAIVDALAATSEDLVENFLAKGYDPGVDGYYGHQSLISRIIESAEAKAKCDRDKRDAEAGSAAS